MGRKDLPTVGVGIMAYNEARNIRALLEALIAQRTRCCRLSEIVVVASGCTDDTESIVQEVARRDPRIRLLSQPKREGKARAINLYLRLGFAPDVRSEPEREAWRVLLGKVKGEFRGAVQEAIERFG